MANNGSEGDFDSIIENESLDGTSEDIEALNVLSERASLLEGDDDEAESETSKLKVLIEKGKDQGYLTYDQLTETLPKSIEESDDFENIVQMFEEMGISIYEVAPAPTGMKDAGEEPINVDPAMAIDVSGKTMDPVRMYMREMGTVPLLTRDGEIEIAKRIEEGIRETMAILARYPGTVERIVEEYERIVAEEGDVATIISGFLDPEDVIPDMSELAEAKSSGNYEADEEEEKKGPDLTLVHKRFKDLQKCFKQSQNVITKEGRNSKKTKKAL